jgi:hypothetical protein
MAGGFSQSFGMGQRRIAVISKWILVRARAPCAKRSFEEGIPKLQFGYEGTKLQFGNGGTMETSLQELQALYAAQVAQLFSY